MVQFMIFDAKVVDNKGRVEYVDGWARPKHVRGKINSRWSFSKGMWTFSLTNYDHVGETIVSVSYSGIGPRPNVAFARWYFFMATGRHIELVLREEWVRGGIIFESRSSQPRL